MSSRRRGAVLLILATCAGIVGHHAFAAYPERPIRLLVGFPPGGGADFTARLVGTELGLRFNQQVVVDNRPGANGNIAAQIAASAPADGYTLLLIPFNFALSPVVTRNLPFNPATDFAAISLVASSPMVLSANAALPVRSVADLVALARERPKTINFGSGGAGSTSHVAAELLSALARVELVHVPYRGAAPALSATIAGEVPIYFGSLPATLPHGRSGRLRLLGVTTARRAKVAPDLPTLQEGGVPGYEFSTWYGVVGPSKTPRAIRTLLHAEIVTMLDKAGVQARLAADGADPVGSDPDGFQKFLAAEIDRWKIILRTSGIIPE